MNHDKNIAFLAGMNAMAAIGMLAMAIMLKTTGTLFAMTINIVVVIAYFIKEHYDRG